MQPYGYVAGISMSYGAAYPKSNSNCGISQVEAFSKIFTSSFQSEDYNAGGGLGVYDGGLSRRLSAGDLRDRRVL